jgi:outer membrane protein TolC
MRPDVRAAERRLAAQSARIGVAKSMWFPKLFINGELGLKTGEFQDWFKRRSLYGSFGPSVSWPIFQGGRIYADVKVEESRTREACLNYELTIFKAYEEVRDMYSNYTREYHRFEALKASVKAAQDAVSISKDLNEKGLKDFTAVIDAQRSLLNLEESLVESRGKITSNLISLYKALGGGLAAE